LLFLLVLLIGLLGCNMPGPHEPVLKSHTVEGLAPGDYYWKVEAVDSEGATAESAVRALNVE
ncbi:MAG: hypothetical protein JW902_05480, partial [Syntrophaceae bacterium]|nr:hypothetical protein [Syntrophaceae bacterium]